MHDPEDNKAYYTAWEMAQTNARHFNEVIIRLRAGTLLVLAAALSSAFAFDKLGPIAIGFFAIGASVLLTVFYSMDGQYYHILLLATVQWASAIEKRVFYSHALPGLAEHVGEVYGKVAGGKTAALRVASFYVLPAIGAQAVGLVLLGLEFNWSPWLLIGLPLVVPMTWGIGIFAWATRSHSRVEEEAEKLIAKAKRDGASSGKGAHQPRRRNLRG